jgi:hypothetical protein
MPQYQSVACCVAIAFPQQKLAVCFKPRFGGYAMKQLPDEKALLELLEIAKEAESKVRELYEMGESFAQTWESRLGDRRLTKKT